MLQHSSGTIYLILWLEVTSTDAANDLPAKLYLPTPMATVTVYRPDRSIQAVASYSHTAQVSLRVPDSPVIVALTP